VGNVKDILPRVETTPASFEPGGSRRTNSKPDDAARGGFAVAPLDALYTGWYGAVMDATRDERDVGAAKLFFMPVAA
jgi:hypothetical protein